MAVRKKIAARKKISVEDQERMVAALQQKNEEVKKDVPAKKVVNTRTVKASNKTQRVTVDFPQEMYEQMKEETQMNGQTLRGFVVSLVRKHLAKREE